MIILYYHICELGNWKEIIKEQLDLIEKSEIPYHEIRIGFLGNVENIKPYLSDKIKLVYTSENIKEYEIPTINKLIDYCKETQENNHILYIHSKGAMSNANNWRRLMNNWLIENWKMNIDCLKDGYDTCGILKMKDHYRGNFWWVNSHFVKYHKRKINYYKNRLAAEFWLLRNKTTNHKCLYRPKELTLKILYSKEYNEYNNCDRQYNTNS